MLWRISNAVSQWAAEVEAKEARRAKKAKSFAFFALLASFAFPRTPMKEVGFANESRHQTPPDLIELFQTFSGLLWSYRRAPQAQLFNGSPLSSSGRRR
jgi:hypothetical protein